jgi:hypothetical protein
MIAFIDEHREQYGVESICRVLPIAPASYYAHRRRRLSPDERPERIKRDQTLREGRSNASGTRISRCTELRRCGGSCSARVFAWPVALSNA